MKQAILETCLIKNKLVEYNTYAKYIIWLYNKSYSWAKFQFESRKTFSISISHRNARNRLFSILIIFYCMISGCSGKAAYKDSIWVWANETNFIPTSYTYQTNRYLTMFIIEKNVIFGCFSKFVSWSGFYP